MSFRAATAWSLIYVAVGARVRSRARDRRRLEPRDTVPRRLRRREEPVGRQPVRVRGHHEHVRGAAPSHQSRVLGIGIALALVLRGIFIAAGSVLLATFSFMFLVFGIGLIATAVQLFRHRDEDPSVSDNAVVRSRAAGCR